jgi:hypothetical protein
MSLSISTFDLILIIRLVVIIKMKFNEQISFFEVMCSVNVDS